MLAVRHVTSLDRQSRSLQENMLALLYSAQDPTANVMCHLVIELGRHDRVLTKLQAEQAQVG